MPEKPLLILPTPTAPAERGKKQGGGSNVNKPSRARQGERLGPRFTALQNTLDARKASLQSEVTGMIPEEVLVLETAGPVKDFAITVRNAGIEWLGEIEEEDIPPDDDFFEKNKKGEKREDKLLRGRLFLVFSNQEALNQLQSLWQRWQSNQSFERGQAKWEELFSLLRDIRPWGVRDRLLETGVLEDWRERVEHNEETVPCEIELWFRQDETLNTRARDRVKRLVEAKKGSVIKEASISDISYHALLVELPIATVNELLGDAGQDAEIVQCEQIQFFRASGQMAGIISEDERQPDTDGTGGAASSLGLPVVGLLDGLPLQNHQRLVNRLIVDDPDDVESQYQANERRHGTAMASLIVHGDLNEDTEPLKRKLYIRPIFQPDSKDWNPPRGETIPENTLVVDLIHRAVRRIFEGEGSEPASASTVCTINLSIGIRDRLFHGAMSPLARLLDWLAWKYKVLFVVSSGNHLDPIEIPLSKTEVVGLEPGERQKQFIQSIAADTRNRRLLSPAEAVNVLTVGATNDDSSDGGNIAHSISPYVDGGIPSPVNAQGMGYRRAIKPDILAPGGRIVLTEDLASSTNARYNIYRQTRSPGQRVAAPGTQPGDLGSSWHTRGTSNSTAIISRYASILYDVLDELQQEDGSELLDEIPRALWLKTLLVHGANWGDAGRLLKAVLKTKENSRQFKEYVTRLIGFGSVNIERVKECTERRATALGGGILRSDQAHIHRFPLPPSLSGQRGWRSLAITMSWFTPVNPAHQAWRRADMWFTPPTSPLSIKRQQAEWRAVKRGTVQHEILEGESASSFVDGDCLEIQVNCKADAGTLEEDVPYTLATTLEIADEIGVDIYNEVRVRVQTAEVVVTP